MFYPKNVPNWERILRIGAGIALTALMFVGGASPISIGLLLMSAVFVIVTGFIGFCPMCAMFGRKLKIKKP
jgi:hypothetical protein